MAVRGATASSLDKVLICSDNQSLLCATASGTNSAVDIVNLIQQSPTDIHMQWMPSHWYIRQ